jgi:peptidoglycan L-alanyl-D-glutamate endopeptidase CwlK
MPNYSKESLEKLRTCEPDLITVFTEVIKYLNLTIIYGYRSPSIQMQLFRSGRIFKDGKWVIDRKDKVVTYCDGTEKKSNHNYNPSRAVDIAPYPIDWNDRERMYFFAGAIMESARRLREERKISHDLRWGGDWDLDTEVQDQTFMDLAHFELII